jgi:mRNA-degrading endonuclease toxin of MazEF toxin-antitoxin module
MNVGDVYSVEFPARGGHEQAGRRPAIVVQGRRASAQVPTVLCIPFTSQLDALRFPGTVLVEADANNGLRKPSVALVFQLTAIDRRHVTTRLGSLSATTLAAIWKALDELAERTSPAPGGAQEQSEGTAPGTEASAP